MHRISFGLLGLALAAATFSCGGDDEPSDDHGAGNLECQELGRFCHEPGEVDAAAEECHELMHEAKDGCMDRYDECQAICQAVIDAGSGGSGGAADGGGSGAGGAG